MVSGTARVAIFLASISVLSGYANASDFNSEGYGHLWKVLCPVIGYRHGFVEFGDLQRLLGIHTAKPTKIDAWTSVVSMTAENPSKLSVRLDVSRYENGRTSGSIQQYPYNTLSEMRSELSLSMLPVGDHLTVDTLAKDLGKLGFRELGGVVPSTWMGEKVYGRDNGPEEVRIRYIEGVEEAPDVGGITVIGYRWKGEQVVPVTQGACS